MSVNEFCATFRLSVFCQYEVMLSAGLARSSVCMPSCPGVRIAMLD